MKEKVFSFFRKLSPYLPESKALQVTFVAVIVAGLFMLFSSIDFSSNKKEEVAKKSGDEYIKLLAGVTSQDDDNDGLKNWEESLWGTDAKNSDTDRDGTKDGEEVSAGRNPVVAGPNDKMTDTSNVLNASSTKSLSQKLSLTENFSREFFTKYMEVKSANYGGEIPKEFYQGIISRSFEDAAGNSELFPMTKTYSAKDLIVSSDNSVEALKKYGNITAETIFKTFKASKVERSELEILQEVLETKNYDKLSEIKKVVIAYHEIIEKMLLIHVPEKFSSLHVEFLNDFSGFKEAINSFLLVEEDPMTTIMNLKNHQLFAEKILKTTQKMGSLFSSSGVIFDNETSKNFFQQQ